MEAAKEVKEAAKENVRERGVCRWFDAPRGYGFIERQDGSDIFVHFSSLIQDGYKNLEDGEVVEYTPIQTKKGLAAREVVVL